MKILKTQSGMSLIEVVIALALVSVSAKALMDYNQNLFKNESDNRIKKSLTKIKLELDENFNKREVCNSNLTDAFRGKDLSKGEVFTGSSETIRSKTNFDVSGNPVIRKILEKNQLLENDKVLVSDVKYELRNVEDTGSMTTIGWRYQARLDVTVEFSYCRKMMPMVRRPASQIICEPNYIVKETKTVSRQINFNKSGNNIKEIPINTGVPGPNQTIPSLDVNCSGTSHVSDSDRKICWLKATRMASSGGSGDVPDCDLRVRIESVPPKKITSTGFYMMPSGFVSNSFRIIMSGGGGGGGGGESERPGSGGEAGEVRTIILPDSAAGTHCDFVIGKGGSSSSRGHDTILRCKNAGIEVLALGGQGGKDGGMDEDLDRGADGENSLWGDGGKGGGRDYDKILGVSVFKKGEKGGVGAPGAGGGGGGDTPRVIGAGRGGRGGDGIFEITWDELYIEDKVTRELLTFPPTNTFKD